MGDLVETRVQWNNGLPVAGLIIRDGLQGHGLQRGLARAGPARGGEQSSVIYDGCLRLYRRSDLDKCPSPTSRWQSLRSMGPCTEYRAASHMRIERWHAYYVTPRKEVFHPL